MRGAKRFGGDIVALRGNPNRQHLGDSLTVNAGGGGSYESVNILRNNIYCYTNILNVDNRKQ